MGCSDNTCLAANVSTKGVRHGHSGFCTVQLLYVPSHHLSSKLLVKCSLGSGFLVLSLCATVIGFCTKLFSKHYRIFSVSFFCFTFKLKSCSFHGLLCHKLLLPHTVLL